MSGTPQNNSGRLKRDIGLLGSALLVLNGIIGAGIFGLPAILQAAVGDFSPWLFLISGALMMLIVLSFAELASHFTETGGPILYTYKAFGPFVSFQTGWVLFISRVAATAANANLLIMYAAFLWPGIAEQGFREGALILIAGFLVWINIIGVKNTVRALDVFSLLKILPVLGIIALGLKYVAPDQLFTAHIPDLSEVEGIALLLLYALIGLENCQVVAGETKNPKKNIPKALVGTVVFITLFYFLVQLVYSAAPLEAENIDTPLINLGAVVAGGIGALAITIAAIFSISGNITVGTISGTRMVFALAEEGQLPKWFGHIHGKFATPDNATWFFGIVMAALAVSGTFVWLVIVASLSRLIVYGLSIAAIPRIRQMASEEEKKGAWRLPGGLMIPIGGLILCLWGASQATPDAWAMLGALFTAGLVLYWVSRRWR